MPCHLLFGSPKALAHFSSEAANIVQNLDSTLDLIIAPESIIFTILNFIQHPDKNVGKTSRSFKPVQLFVGHTCN